jgi:hypothetical protein
VETIQVSGLVTGLGEISNEMMEHCNLKMESLRVAGEFCVSLRTVTDNLKTPSGLTLAGLQGGVKVIPKMFNIWNSPTVVFDCRDAQLHLKTQKTSVFSSHNS